MAMEDGEDSAAGASQCTYLAESSAETSAECSRQLATLTKKKAKRSVHRGSQESKKRTRKSSKVENTYSGTPLNGHPSTADTHNIREREERWEGRPKGKCMVQKYRALLLTRNCKRIVINSSENVHPSIGMYGI